MITFHQEGNDHCWFSDDYIWGVIKRFSVGDYLLYKQGTDEYYVFTGFEFSNWEEIDTYIKNHE